MNDFLARQPIFDKNLKVFAYELLYRRNAEHNQAGEILDADQASSRTMVAGLHNMGIERISGGKRAFVNFTERLLLTGMASLFSNQHLVVEILENVRATPEVIRACKKLKASGYTIALDDFEYQADMRPLIELADIVKIDFLNNTIPQIEQILDSIRPAKPILLCEKVETKEVFDQAVEMGFLLFQGYFFSKPTIMAEKKVDPLVTNYMELIREVNRREADFPQMTQIIRRDVGLSYRLLRLVNSAYFGMRYKIKDIQHALAVLGMREVRKWVSLLSMIGIGRDKPDELVRMSVIRGHFLETLVERHRSGDPEQHFIIGLFSLIDVILDQPMEEVLGQLSLTPEVSRALLGEGPARSLIAVVAAFEKGDWESVSQICREAGLPEAELAELYLESIAWSNNFGQEAGMGDETE